MHVLLVEDDMAVGLTGALILRGLGYTVELALTGDDALVERESGRAIPEVLIVDLELPGIPGVEVLRLAREKYPQALLVATSGYPLPDSLVCDVILPKPYGATSLRRCLARALAHRDGRELEDTGAITGPLALGERLAGG